MTVFSGTQKCRRCGKEYEWFGYKLGKGDASYIGTQVPYHFSDAFQDAIGNWTVEVYCKHCGHHDEAENFAIG